MILIKKIINRKFEASKVGVPILQPNKLMDKFGTD